MRFLNYPNAKYRVYQQDDDLVTVVCLYWFNLYAFEQNKFVRFKGSDTIAQFDSEDEAKSWVRKNIAPQFISPSCRLSVDDSSINQSLFRPYINTMGYVTIVEINNEKFDIFDFSRFFDNEAVEGSYIEFDNKERAIEWLYEKIQFHLIDPLHRPLDQKQYFKNK